MPLRQKWCGILPKPAADVPAVAEEMTGVLGAMVIVRKIAVPAMMAVVVASVAQDKIAVVAMNVVVQAALPVVDNAQAQAVPVVDGPKVPEVLAIVLQAVAAEPQVDNVVQMIVVLVLMAAAIVVLVQKEPIAAQDRKVATVVLVAREIVVLAAVINTGMTGISMIVLAFLKVGLSASCPNLVPWKPFRNKSRHPAGPIPFSMSRNFSSPAGIVICCTSITKNQPVARISQRTPRLLRLLKPPQNCCNARSMVRSG